MLDNYKFKLPTPFEAVDFLFKLFFAVDIQYPAYCYHIWQFIQIVGFEIDDPKQKIDIKLKILCNQLKV